MEEYQEQIELKDILQLRKTDLKKKIERLRVFNRLCNSMGCLCLILPLIFNVFTIPNVNGSKLSVLNLVCIIYALIFFLFPLMRANGGDLKMELQEIENELDLLSLKHASNEERSEKLFKHHHLELKRYYDENLKQSSWLFIVGLICILIGFIIIGVTFYFLITNISNELENKLIIASVGAIGAILSNFIAVIYLKMHSETVNSLTQFHNRFVNTHHFHFANFLLSKIENKDKREDALVELAVSINKSVDTKTE